MSRSGELRIMAPDLERFTVEVLKKLGVPEAEARIVADVLVLADLRGVDSHGVGRLHLYVAGLESGVIARRAEVKVVAAYPALALVDGGKGLGQVVSYQAMRRCLDMAGQAGMACVTVTNSNHYGIAAYYALMALERDMIGISLTNSRPHVPPTFGRQAMLGTNPIAMAVPTGRERPWVLDMATSAIPLGKVEVAQRLAKPLREGLAVDGDGLPTTDPEVVLRSGALLPLGGPAETAGYKGYGLSVLVDILTGVLSGAGYCAAMSPVWCASPTAHFFAALRVDAIRPLDEFKAMMDEMIRALRDSPKAVGQERIIIHGEPEFEAEERRRREGIVLPAKVVESLQEIGERLGVPLDPAPPLA